MWLGVQAFGLYGAVYVTIPHAYFLLQGASNVKSVVQERWQAEPYIVVGTMRDSSQAFMLLAKLSWRWYPLFCWPFILSSISVNVRGGTIYTLILRCYFWKPPFFLCDYSEAEISEVEQAFPSTTVYICDFHCEQAWTRWTRDYKNGLSNHEQEQLLANLRACAWAPSPEPDSGSLHDATVVEQNTVMYSPGKGFVTRYYMILKIGATMYVCTMYNARSINKHIVIFQLKHINALIYLRTCTCTSISVTITLHVYTIKFTCRFETVMQTHSWD